MFLVDLIQELEKHPAEKVVPIGFSNPHSYRGYYERLAFEPKRDVTVGEMLKEAKYAIGATYTGWKGGEFTMSDYTEVYLAFEGSCGDELSLAFLRLLLGVSAEEAIFNR